MSGLLIIGAIFGLFVMFFMQIWKMIQEEGFFQTVFVYTLLGYIIYLIVT